MKVVLHKYECFSNGFYSLLYRHSSRSGSFERSRSSIEIQVLNWRGVSYQWRHLYDSHYHFCQHYQRNFQWILCYSYQFPQSFHRRNAHWRFLILFKMIFGIVATLWIKKIYFDSILITNITFVFSYLVYYTADHLVIYGNRFSGIISVLTFGII